MLEIFRVIAKSNVKSRNSIIFLFNGAEEAGLLAAHGFITQHPWAKDIKAFINLDAAGSGGKESLFRTGPKDDWLVQKYRQTTKTPLAQALLEDIFDLDWIPAGTDYSVFVEDGGIPGLDIAYFQSGFRYHTRYDTPDFISKETVQHTGENLLELTKAFADIENFSNDGSTAIYYDYLGLFLVSYSSETAVIINITVSLLAVLVPFAIQIRFKVKNIVRVSFYAVISLVTVVLSTVLSTLACYGVAAAINAADNAMSWYSNTFFLIGIYCSLAVIIQLSVHHLVSLLIKRFVKRKEKENKDVDQMIQAQLIGINLFWAIITITATLFEFRFPYVSMVLLLVSLCTNILLAITCQVLPKTREILVNFFLSSFSFFKHSQELTVGFFFICLGTVLLLFGLFI